MITGDGGRLGLVLGRPGARREGEDAQGIWSQGLQSSRTEPDVYFVQERRCETERGVDEQAARHDGVRGELLHNVISCDAIQHLKGNFSQSAPHCLFLSPVHRD